MDFSDLKTELADRGFSDLSDTRRGVYVNAARNELDRMHLWAWREASVTGTAPLSIPTLGEIEAVTNETLDYRLQAVQFSDLLDWYGDLSTSGSPACYYRASPSGTPAIATYPTNSDTIGVQFWSVEADLSAAGDEPRCPDEMHLLIVELAIRKVAKDPERKAMAQEEIDRQVPYFLSRYPTGTADDSGHVVRRTDWYG
jgi:hypothetical protein